MADVDEVFGRAVKAGARTEMAVQDMFWGDRYGKLTDPFGQQWSIATHKEDLSSEEVAAAAGSLLRQGRRAAVNQEQQAAIKAPAKWCEIEESRAKEIAAT